jgi:DNA ligase-1
MPVHRRTCKHLRRYLGDDAETARLGALPQRSKKSSSSSAVGPGVLLAEKWDQRDPTGWWISEKLDGVRAYWDGTRFLSRTGNEYLAPDWFSAGLPTSPLDGELFVGRKQFQQTVSIARRMDRGLGWKSLTYLVFDAPDHGGIFEERVRHVEALGMGEYAQAVSHLVCEGVGHLQSELARIEGLGGEGLMLRKAGSLYVRSRSDTLLKVKTFHDLEAKVVGHQPGTGKHQGRLGALQVVLPNGTPFKVGTGFSDAERGAPPEVGSVVTVRYQELTNAGVPRFPVYIGERHDFDWNAAVASKGR